MSGAHHDYGKENDEDLLFWMGYHDEDAATASAACTEFYNRHVRYLYSVVGRAHRTTLGQAGIEDIVMETFGRVFEKATTYEPCGAPDERGKTLNVLKWVSAIAQNIAVDHYRSGDAQLQLVDDWNPLEDKIVIPEQREMSPDEMVIRDELASCSERDRTITLVTMQYHDPSRPHQRLPNDVVQDLATTFDTTSENIRQVRKRVLNRLRRRWDLAHKKESARSKG